jgi:hypothetical protein
VAAPLPDIITTPRGLLHDGDLNRSSATGFADLASRASMDLITPTLDAESRYDRRFDLTAPDAVGGLRSKNEVKQALSSA